jgi:hypothetical protein
MFDMIFRSEDALQLFIQAAQAAIDQFTPPRRCEELWMRYSFVSIRAHARNALGDSYPVMVAFEEDDRYQAELLCEDLMVAHPDKDMETTLGILFD